MRGGLAGGSPPMQVNVYGTDSLAAQIEQLVQLNEGQRYTLDRAALIKMLGEALATARPRTQ
jgi:hypothetical protein